MEKARQVIYNPEVRDLCSKPYPRHPKGCPNFGTRDSCPPKAKLFHDYYRKDKPVVLIYNIFEFGKHVERMRHLHPDWSDAQAGCCLYWQGTARKKLREYIDQFLQFNSEFLQWSPKTLTYQIAVAGIPIGENK